MSCEHPDFNAWVDVNRVLGPDKELIGFAADVRIECAVCKRRFGFRGLTPGMPANKPGVSVDAIEAHLPLISAEELDALGPLAALQMPSGLAGYEVRVRDVG